jgi:hypothetical protein
MEESFLLKHYGHLSIPEQYTMTAEERHWWLKRIDEENKRQSKESHSTLPPGKIPESPGRPPV